MYQNKRNRFLLKEMERIIILWQEWLLIFSSLNLFTFFYFILSKDN